MFYFEGEERIIARHAAECQHRYFLLDVKSRSAPKESPKEHFVPLGVT